MKRIKLFEDFINEAKEYKKGDKVTIQDGKVTKDAVVAKDGIKMHRGDAQVIVRIKGFPMDMGISLDSSKPAYIIENSINEARDINLKLSRDESNSLRITLIKALEDIHGGDGHMDITRVINKLPLEGSDVTKDIKLKLSRDERDSVSVTLKKALKDIHGGDTHMDITRVIKML